MMIFRLYDENTIKDMRDDNFGYFLNEMQGYIFCSDITEEARNLLDTLYGKIDLNKHLKYDPVNKIIDVLSFNDKVDILLQEKIKMLSDLNKNYINSRYELPRQISFATLKFDTIIPKVINGVEILGTNYELALNKLDEIKVWIFNYPMTYYYQEETNLKMLAQDIKNGTKDISELENINEESYDFLQFNQYDPVIEIAQIKNILMGA